jgi:hypothetical protein
VIRSVSNKGNMDKVNRIYASKFMVFVTCSIFVIAYFAPIAVSDAQPDDEWVAHPMYISPFGGFPAPVGYSPSQIRTAYNLPSSGGAGTTIAIIGAYDTPNILNYYNAFSIQYGLPDNTTGNFVVHKMSSNMRTDSDWAMETCLDVEWAHAIAPDAKILLVEAVSNSRNSLLSAVDYATSYPGVVAVSMSWGGAEFSNEANYYYDSHFNKPGITFFAASGDDGSGVMWPAVSANVVGVGGTTLNLNADGTVISETAWRNSSGGLSKYVASPAYQTSYGLTYSKRAVPDVSYNGNASTGVAVYNGTWWKIGGTSAGAPQWAAIHALGLSVTNSNLYRRAKSAYSSYFRDISSGSNYVNPATADYDLVTGLGSPLKINFGTEVTVSPTSGPPAGAITLNGVGFTAGSSVNISYLNPLTSTWVSITNNSATPSQGFSYAMNAPDFLQNNTAGDNQPFYDSIVFRAQDNSNGYSYNTTVPYTEWRRGLAQVGDSVAAGLYGNNTNLATNVFVQNGQSVFIAGKWFNPGNTSMLWDGIIDLGTILTDETGFFNTSVLVPTTTVGLHMLTIRDNNSDFCVNLTRLPTVSNDYVDLWHTSDFTINLTPDYNVNETFYRINDGPVCNVTANGQPTITTEGSDNTLEYWSTWNIYGTGIMELTHVTLTGIKLDKTAPTGSITVNSNYVDTTTVTLTLSAADSNSGIAQMRFSNDNNEWSSWEPYDTSKTWTLTAGDGTKIVTVQYMDNAGLSSTYNCTTILDTTEPIANAGQNKDVSSGAVVNFDASGSSDESGIVSYPSPSPSATTIPTLTPITSPSAATPQIPEYSAFIALFFMITVLAIAMFTKKAATKTRK